MPNCKFQLLFLALLASTAITSFAQAEQRPNVIVIMTDDQGYGEFSCHGNPIAQTPSIDRLARESVRLTDFHVSPMCTPTRGQLMTGLDAFRNGAVNVSSGRTLLRPELTTIADVFQSAGYRTGMFGKWHLGDNYPFRPEDRGFEEAVWFPSSHINSVPDVWNNDYFDDTYIHNTKRQRYRGYCTDVFFNQAKKWLGNQEADRPFFAYIALNAAHSPWFVADRYRDEVRRAMQEHPEVVKSLTPRKRANLVSFLAMGANIDENVGRFDEYLEAAGLKQNTIVVFLTDNGSTMGPDYYNAGMRGKKTTLWEGGHRVPCFIRWPAGLKRPREVSELCQVQDLLPTLAELSGIGEHVPAQLDGTSLKSLLQAEQPTLGDRKLVINYSRMPSFRVRYTNGNPAIPHRDGACVMWKYWRLLENRELYHIDNDPHQDHDVAAEHPEVVKQMRAHLVKWWNGVKQRALTPQRVVIGDEAENPLRLTACEWLDVFVDQQVQIRRGVRKNGSWHVTVAQSGRYEFELRRWPRESGLKLFEGCPRLEVTDGTFGQGRALPIRYAKMSLGEQMVDMNDMTNDQTAFRVSATLEQGPLELRTFLLDESKQEIAGAYYLYVNRVSPQPE